MARKGVYGPQVSEEATKGIDLDEAGSAEIVPIASIQVDEDYQRDLRYDLVNKIAKEWDIVKAGPILLNERDVKHGEGEGLWCVDGQHRMVGADQAGEEEIFANVVHGLTRKEEAELRLARNDRRSDNTFEKFRARLIAGDEKVAAIIELCRQQGTKLNLQPNLQVGVNALVTAETLYDAGAGEGLWLGRVLVFIKDTFGEERMGGTALGANMMKATAWFLDRHVRVNKKELSEKLARAGMDEIDRQARNQRAINGGAGWLNYYRAMVAIWNFGRSDANKIETKTSGGIGQLGEAGSVPVRNPRARSEYGDGVAGYS